MFEEVADDHAKRFVRHLAFDRLAINSHLESDTKDMILQSVVVAVTTDSEAIRAGPLHVPSQHPFAADEDGQPVPLNQVLVFFGVEVSFGVGPCHLAAQGRCLSRTVTPDKSQAAAAA